MVEQGTENPRVGSSILSLGTTEFRAAVLRLFFLCPEYQACTPAGVQINRISRFLRGCPVSSALFGRASSKGSFSRGETDITASERMRRSRSSAAAIPGTAGQNGPRRQNRRLLFPLQSPRHRLCATYAFLSGIPKRESGRFHGSSSGPRPCEATVSTSAAQNS